MIDGFIMRDPGSYDDIIDILEDEKVIQSEQAIPLKAFISLRSDDCPPICGSRIR